MHIVEVAGTGTVGRSNCWRAATDIGLANLTKTQLEQFFSYIASARTSSNTLIRSSNLLKILGNAFSVSSVIRFISHVRITEEDLNITLSTLRFTAKIARLKPVKVKEDVKHRSDLTLHRLQDEVNALKKELMINDLFLQQEPLMNISKSRMEQINRSILNFLNGKISDFTLFSVSQAQALLKSIKDLYNRLTAKELEVEQLKEMYENFTKNAMQSSESSILPKETALSTDDQASAQRRSRPSRISLEVKEIPKEIEKEEVGSLDKSGMTLGPYAEEEEKMTDPEKTVKISKPLITPEQARNTEQQNILVVRQLFERFLKEMKEYARIKEKLDKNAKTLAAVRQRFSNSIDNYFQAKRNLENVRDKLSKHQQIRYAMEPETREDEENDVVPEVEKMIYRDILCHQKVLVNLEEEVRQEQDEINELFKQHVEMCSKLESGFREYCKKMDLLLFHSDKPLKILLKPVEKESLEIIRRKFNKFQRTMLHRNEETGRTKRVQFDCKRT